MSSKTISDLRSSLFETIEQLQAGKIDIDRAKAISEVAGRIIDSAKVEVDYQRVTGQAAESRFLAVADARDDDETERPQTSTLPSGIVGIRRHRLEG